MTEDLRIPSEPHQLAKQFGYSSPFGLPAVDAVRLAYWLLRRNTWDDHQRAIEVLRQCVDRTVGGEGR